ncbi:MAG TPA: Hsp20/alpha crystallin family protein [Gammaproteobacteria bacterium]|nr:Hsp20/alpha crystallin family protein [Gammaproteobacteria bacterium]
MAYSSYDPFSLMEQLQQEVNRLFDARQPEARAQGVAVTSDWVPLVDIREKDEAFVISADIPGVDPSQVEITMENGVLAIRGNREESGNGFKRRERPMGSFYRRFVLPDTADAEGVTAQGKNGVLEINIPKRRQAQARRIKVES